MVDLAHVVVLGHRVGTGLIELAAVDDADRNVGLAQVDRADLLIDVLFGDSLLLARTAGMALCGIGNVRWVSRFNPPALTALKPWYQQRWDPRDKLVYIT